MISEESLNIDWINKVAKQNNIKDKILIEKVIRALFLLEKLVEQKFDFVFKGGTALMLLLGSTRRLSIDIDIITTDAGRVDDFIDRIVAKKYFSKFELQHRKTQTSIKKAHYKLFYKPEYKTNKTNEFILLDVLFEKPQYLNLISIPIHSVFIQQENEPLYVKVPDFNNILGDKLTAFAPNTTGIPYEKNGKPMGKEIIKQLYDIGTLFNEMDNLQLVEKVFRQFAQTELKYRKFEEDIQPVLTDIYETALSISTKGKSGNAKFSILQKGIQQLSAYIFSENYHIEKAVTDASKVAYLAKLIQFKLNVFERFDNPLQITDWEIKQPFNTKLNKLKKTNPEAFFYWYKIYELDKQFL